MYVLAEFVAARDAVAAAVSALITLAYGVVVVVGIEHTSSVTSTAQTP